MARDASTAVDAIYTNPAGTTEFKKTRNVSLNSQTVWQTRIINTTFATGAEKEYEGEAFVPSMPSLLAAWKHGNVTISGAFTIAGGGGTVEYDDGLPMFNAFTLGMAPTKGMLLSDVDANSYGGGIAFKATDWMKINLGYFHSFYYEWKGDKEAYGKNNYDRENQMVGIGVDLTF